jgi:soluble lytic murein transglycosylase-like protein
MKITNITLTSTFLLSMLIIICSFTIFKYNDFDCDIISSISDKNNDMTNSMMMYENIEKYSQEYDIPKYILYNIAYLETTYQGPFDWKYNHRRESSVGALGPMQIMPTTANEIHKNKISTNKLKNDIGFNVKTSAIMLNKLYVKYKNWEIVCGYYNTGRPIINQYATFCVDNRSYKNKWVNNTK